MTNAFDVTVRLIALLLQSSGEGVQILDRYLGRVGPAFGLDLHLLILPDAVVATDRNSQASTAVSIVHATPGISRLDRVADLKRLVMDIEQGLSVAEADLRLEAITRAPSRWPRWLRVIGVAMFAAGFAPSVVATPSEIGASILLGACMGFLLVMIEGRRWEPLLPFIGAFVLTLIATTALSGVVERSGVALVLIPALFVVIPGDGVSAAAGELLTGRITAGASRLVYAILILGLLIVGMVAASELTGGANGLFDHVPNPELSWIVVTFAWVVFAVGLMLTFNAHLNALPWLIASVIGTYLLQQAATRLGGDITGTLVAGIVLGAIANRVSASRDNPPRLIMVIGGFFVLTVGGLGLRGATALLGGDLISGFHNLAGFLTQVPTVAVAIAIGILATGSRHQA